MAWRDPAHGCRRLPSSAPVFSQPSGEQADALGGSGKADSTDGPEKGPGKTLHVYKMAAEARQCLNCGTVLDAPDRRRGKPQEFCRRDPGQSRDCRRLFWQRARILGGQLLRRRRVRAARPPRPRTPALDPAARARVVFLLALGHMMLQILLGVDGRGMNGGLQAILQPERET